VQSVTRVRCDRFEPVSSREVTAVAFGSRPSRQGKHSRAVGSRENLTAYLFLLPWIAGFVGLTLLPMGMSLLLSFTDYNLFDPPRPIGVENFVTMIRGDDWHYPAAFTVTLRYVLFAVPLQLLVSLLLAFVLNRGLPGLAVFRLLFYVPSLLGASVAVGILWRQIFGAQGILNVLLVGVGFEWARGLSWIAEPRHALSTIIALRVWQFGSPMIIFLAGLKQIPQEVLEAAEIAGATRTQRAWMIVLPMLSPIILFNFIMQIISAFKVFTEAFIVSGGATGGGLVGGTLDSLLFYTIHIYSEGFVRFRMGYAMAMSWVLIALIGGFTWLAFRSSSRWVHYD
jgi:multiple sugar transport system permease protein